MILRKNTLVIKAYDCKFDIHDRYTCRTVYISPNVIMFYVPIAKQDIYNMHSIDKFFTTSPEIDICLCDGEYSMISNKKAVMSKLRKEFKNGINIIDEINFELGDDVDIIKVLENNPIISNIKIVLAGKFNLNELDKLYELDKKYKNYQNIYVELDGNSSPVTIKDAIKTIEILNTEVNKIKKLNLSPFETIMYVYDLVRDQEYTEEDPELETSLASRDLTRVLLGDKIVCVGFSHKFTALLKMLDIPCYNISLDTKRDGHMRNIIHVKDEKYDVDGVYCFDTTWDCKDDDTNDFLNSYQHFAKTLYEMQKIDRNRYKYPDIFDIPLKDLIDSFTEYVKSNSIDKDDIINKYIDPLFEMEKFAGLEGLLRITEDNVTNYIRWNQKEFIEDFIYDIHEVYKCYDKPISDDTFMNLLTNVRKIEHEQDPEKYPFDNNTIFNICFNSNKILSLCTLSNNNLALCTLSNNNRTKNVNNIVNAIKKSKVKKML